MKTKLLKKIRKRFVIEYYPNDDLYYLKGHYFENRCRGKWFVTKEGAIEEMLYQIRNKYKKKCQQQNKPIKLWWNGNS